MESKHFQRRVEDFVCGHCGAAVSGNGYTNHCPKCLYSRHVDINPGDRLNECLGLMKPIAVESTSKGYVITHQCLICGHTGKNKSAEADDFQALINVVKNRPV